MPIFDSIFGYLFESDDTRKTWTTNEISARADKASAAVQEWARKGTSNGDMQAIRRYRKDTGASLNEALRVVKELKWRASIDDSLYIAD